MEIDSATLNTFLAAITALILAIIAWLNKQRTDIAKTAQNNAAAVTAAPITTAPVPTAPVPTAPAGISYPTAPGQAINWLSFKVTPTLLYGLKSPSTLTFRFEGTQPQPDHPGIVAVSANWDDGSSDLITLKNGYAEIKHTFTFKATDEYTGWTFNPIFLIHGSDGSSRIFNEDGTSVEIGIEV
jgi:hypothetical protein